jgi:hypothetical protein
MFLAGFEVFASLAVAANEWKTKATRLNVKSRLNQTSLLVDPDCNRDGMAHLSQLPDLQLSTWMKQILTITGLKFSKGER